MWLLTPVQDIPWPYLEGKRVPGSKPFPVAGQTEFVLHRHRRTLCFVLSSQFLQSVQVLFWLPVLGFSFLLFSVKANGQRPSLWMPQLGFDKLLHFGNNGLKKQKWHCNKDSRVGPLGFLVLKCMPLFHTHTIFSYSWLWLAAGPRVPRVPTCNVSLLGCERRTEEEKSVSGWHIDETRDPQPVHTLCSSSFQHFLSTLCCSTFNKHIITNLMEYVELVPHVSLCLWLWCKRCLVKYWLLAISQGRQCQWSFPLMILFTGSLETEDTMVSQAWEDSQTTQPVSNTEQEPLFP